MKNYKILNLFSFLILFNPVLVAQDLDKLVLESGFKISIFAENMSSPRQMAQGTNGTIFVGERTGQIIALIDADQNGQSDQKRVIAENLEYSTGVSIFNGDLYFSEINKIWKVENIEAWLNENIVNSDLPKNSVGFDFHPVTKKLFFTDNGRDWLGDDSPSCELNRLDQAGQFFGYPFKHAADVMDPEFGEINSGFDYVDPILELGAHVAPTGITFYEGSMFPVEMKNNLFISLHGSWNRSSKVGYKVIRVSFDENGNAVDSHDFITGWLQNESAFGRPSAPLIMSDGSMLLSDDKANVIYRISYES